MVMEIIMSFILLFVGIAILIIIHVCVVGRGFRDDHNPMNGINLIPGQVGRIPRMSPEDIMELPIFDYNENGNGNKNENGNEDVDCAICLENFRTGDKYRILAKCNHSFHVECIDSWLLKNGACPICRTCAAKSQEIEQNRTSYSSEDGVVELV